MFCQDLQNQTACSSQSNEPLIHKIQQKVEFGSLSAVVNDTADPDCLHICFLSGRFVLIHRIQVLGDCSDQGSDKTKAHDPGEELTIVKSMKHISILDKIQTKNWFRFLFTNCFSVCLLVFDQLSYVI